MNNKIGTKAFFLLIPPLFIFSFAFADEISQEQLQQVSLGMKNEQIISVLGKPDFIRSEGVNGEGKTVERLEYNVTEPIDLPPAANKMGNNFDKESRSKLPLDRQGPPTYTCSLVTLDGKLVRIETQSENPKNDSNDYHPQTQDNHGISLNS